MQPWEPFAYFVSHVAFINLEVLFLMDPAIYLHAFY